MAGALESFFVRYFGKWVLSSFMKIFAACLLAGILSASGRTWTSADDSKVIEGDFKGFDSEKKQVSIEVEGQVVTFDLDKLSEADQGFVKSQVEEEAKAEKKVNVRELVMKAPLHQIVDGKFVKTEFEAEPEYYLFYFSASW